MGTASGLLVLSMCVLAVAVGVVLWNQKESDPIAKAKADANNTDIGDKGQVADPPKPGAYKPIKKDNSKKADQKPLKDGGKIPDDKVVKVVPKEEPMSKRLVTKRKKSLSQKRATSSSTTSA